MIAFALLVFLLVSVLCAIPFAAIEKMAEMEEQEKVSASYLFFYMFQMLIYLVVWLVISMIFGLEWIEDRSNSFRNNIRQHSMHFIAASMYVVQLAFCALLFFAPTWKFTIAQHAWMVFLLLDAFYLFLLRRWILSILSEAVQQTYDWFMEEQEEHLFLAEEFNE